MTQTMAYPQPQVGYSQPQYLMVPVRESNGLGVAGFFIALIGVFIPTGIVAVLGLLISLVALGRAPRGFATMGVLVGLLGSVIWLAITGVAVLGALIIGLGAVFAGAAAFIITQPETVKVTSDMINVAMAAMEYEDDNGSLPPDLSVLSLKQTLLTDPWGNPYRYQLVVDDPGFDVVSAGDDGIMGTDDDLALSRLDEMWEEAAGRFGEGFEQLGKRIQRLDDRRGRHRPMFHSPGTSPAKSSRHASAARS